MKGERSHVFPGGLPALQRSAQQVAASVMVFGVKRCRHNRLLTDILRDERKRYGAPRQGWPISLARYTRRLFLQACAGDVPSGSDSRHSCDNSLPESFLMRAPFPNERALLEASDSVLELRACFLLLVYHTTDQFRAAFGAVQHLS